MNSNISFNFLWFIRNTPHSPPRFSNDHLRTGLVELLPQLPLVKDDLNVLNVLKEESQLQSKRLRPSKKMQNSCI